MTVGTWIGKVIALATIVLFDILVAMAGMYWLHLSEFWTMFLLVSVNTTIIIQRMVVAK